MIVAAYCLVNFVAAVLFATLAQAWGGIREDQFTMTVVMVFALLSLTSWVNHRYGGGR